MNPADGSKALLRFEAPYGPKILTMSALAISLSVGEFAIIFAANQENHDHATSFVSGILWCMAVLAAYPLAVAFMSLAVRCLVPRTLKLTAIEISAPRTGYSLQSTVVPLREIRKVTVRSTADGRYMNIYHSAGRLGIAESWLPNSEAFERVLAAVRAANTTSTEAPAKQLCSLPSWHDDP